MDFFRGGFCRILTAAVAFVGLVSCAGQGGSDSGAMNAAQSETVAQAAERDAAQSEAVQARGQARAEEDARESGESSSSALSDKTSGGAEPSGMAETSESGAAAQKSGAKKDEENAMRLYVVPTRQNENLDFIQKVPSEKIVFNAQKKAYKGEFLTVVPFVLNAADGGGKYDVEYSFKMVSPIGRESVFAQNRRIAGGLKSGKSVLWLPEKVQIMFEKSDDWGAYKLVLDVKNNLTGKVSRVENELFLIPWTWQNTSPIAGESDYWNNIKLYNLSPSPEALARIYFAPYTRILSDSGALDFTQYMFFREAFRSKPFLLDVLLQKFDTMGNGERLNTIMLFAALGELPRLEKMSLTDSEKSLLENAFSVVISIVSPYEKVGGRKLESLLWGEFYARGNYAPIERMFGYISDYDSAKDFVEKLKSGADVSALGEAKLRSDVLYLQTALSMMQNLELKLAAGYMDYYLATHKGSFSVDDLRKAFLLVKDYLNFQSAKTKAARAAAAQKAEQEKQAKQPQRSGQSSPLRQEMRVGEKAGGESGSVEAGAGSKSGEAEKSPEAKTGGTKSTEAKAK